MDEFNKVIHDFHKDLLFTFPELESKLINSSNLYEYCQKIYPEKFFDILYQNEKLFETRCFLLPEIDFSQLWKENISDKTKETIWKYLQLVLFTVVSDMSSKDSFGDTAKLFEAINEDAFKDKLEETISQMQECFDFSENNTELPNPDTIHEHITGMMDGKLGKFAKEIAEETAEEMNINAEDATSVGDIFQKLLKDPANLMGLVKKVGGRLDDKLKSGDLKESELLEEASDLMNKMKDIPGMSNLQSMFGQGKGKMNMGAMKSQLQRNMRAAKQRERLQKKVSEKTDDDNNVNGSINIEEAIKQADLAMEQLLAEEKKFSTGDKIEQTKRKKKKKKKKKAD